MKSWAIDNLKVSVTPVVDTTPPAPPTLTLASDSGTPGDGMTNSGVVNVTGLESGATWEYSTDGGQSWTPGSGSSLTLAADGSYNVLARQTDVAGNLSANSSALAFTLDTQVSVTLALANDTGTPGDGFTSDATLTGLTEAGALVFIEDGRCAHRSGHSRIARRRMRAAAGPSCRRPWRWSAHFDCRSPRCSLQFREFAFPPDHARYDADGTDDCPGAGHGDERERRHHVRRQADRDGRGRGSGDADGRHHRARHADGGCQRQLDLHADGPWRWSAHDHGNRAIRRIRGVARLHASRTWPAATTHLEGVGPRPARGRITTGGHADAGGVVQCPGRRRHRPHPVRRGGCAAWSSGQRSCRSAVTRRGHGG